MTHNEKISAGSYDLNKWLYGGYERGVVTVFYGAPASGKTNFCMLAAVSQAKKGNKVVYVDTEGGFSTERVKQLAQENTKDVLKNIILLNPTNFEEQEEAFKKLLKYLKENVNLIIVDGMTILYRLDLAAAREKEPDSFHKVNAHLAWQMKTLAEIARKNNLSVLITNQVYRWEESDKMVAGDILRYWGKCLIELVYQGGKRTAYLRKHRNLPESSFPFTIVSEGIKKRGWL